MNPLDSSAETPASHASAASCAASDSFSTYDAAYVLGALSPSERDAYVEHLRGCASCSAAVAELAGLPGLLGRVPLSVVERELPAAPPVPASTLPWLLRRVQRVRRRRRMLTGTMALAACFLAAVAVVWHPVARVGPPAEASSTIRLQPVHTPSPVVVTAQLTSAQWGTRIGLHCKYQGSADPSYVPSVYSLVVLDNRGNRAQAATWRAVPGEVTINASTSVTATNIASIEVDSADGSTLLRAAP